MLSDYVLRKTTLRSFPVEISIGITSHCNSNCFMCPREEIKKHLGFMDFKLFKKIINEAKDYVELVYLHFDGEPLMHPQFFEMVKYCKDNGVTAGISTNAVLLDADRAQKLIDSGLDYLIISIDAASPETYKKVKGTDDYKRVVGNVKNYLILKKKAEKGPYTALQLIYLKENKEEAGQFKRLWKPYKADTLRIKPVLTFAGDVDLKNQDLAYSSNPCVYLWRQLSIHWDGVVTCIEMCRKMPLGNIKDKSLKEIWNSKTLVSLRKFHLRGDKNKMSICKNCNVPGLNLPIMLAGTIMNDFSFKKNLIRYEKLSLFVNSMLKKQNK